MENNVVKTGARAQCRDKSRALAQKIQMQNYTTYSIVGLDTETGEIGGAAASCALAVGSAVIHIHENTIIHTQHMASPVLANDIFVKISKGESAKVALASILESDENIKRRQIILATTENELLAHTGTECELENSHVVGVNCVAAGNSLDRNEVIARMVAIFEENISEPLPLRLLRAIEEGERVQADKRGKQSAALKVTAPANQGEWYMYPNLRVDDHKNPVQELARLWGLFEERRKSWS